MIPRVVWTVSGTTLGGEVRDGERDRRMERRTEGRLERSDSSTRPITISNQLLLVASLISGQALPENAKVLCGDGNGIGQSATKNGLLFVGDSDVDYWRSTEANFESSITNGAVYNVGYGGYSCRDVHREVGDMVEAFEPATVALVCGENDLGGGGTVDITYDKVRTSGSELPNASLCDKPTSITPRPLLLAW